MITKRDFFVTILLFFLTNFSFAETRNVEASHSTSLSSVSLNVKFAYLTDVHISVGTTNVEDLENSVKDINTMGDIEFVILGGDITEFGSDQEILLAKSILDKLTCPYYILSGNHDSKWSESGCNTFAKVFGYESFDFEVGGIRFIGCNSGPNMRMAPALVPRESIVWLDSLTKAIPRGTPVIFVNHYPLTDEMLNYKDVLNFLSRTNIQLALCGHGHNNRKLSYQVPVSPAMTIRGAMGRSNLRAGRASSGYNIITVADGKISMAERMNGVTLSPWNIYNIIAQNKQVAAAGSPSATASSTDQKQNSKSQINQEEQLNSTGKLNSGSQIKPLWVIQDNTDIGSGATYSGGVVYYANTAGVVKALDAKNGSLIWSYKTGGKIFSTPAVSKGRLVVGCTDGYIYCLDTKGGLVWKVKAEKSVLPAPAIYKEIVYIGASDGVFRALRLKDGSEVWRYSGIKGFVEAKAYVDDEGVYIGDWRNTFYAFNSKTGALLWTWTNKKQNRMLSPAAVWPVKAHGKVFIVTPERVVYALNAADGKELWSANGGREAIGLSSDKKAIYIKTMQDTVFAWSAVSNVATRVWSSFSGYGYEIAPSPITTQDGLLLIPTDKGNIFALRESDGKVAWSYNFSIALINYIQPLGRHRILVSSMDGKVGIILLNTGL
ncbi:MAG: PQQ-binding-like beta-propeller repeat protein [Bacteroidales bacterium]|nr:PQQ-binding-like beta-propeller repeat protein [Bacteroidales bacterium]